MKLKKFFSIIIVFFILINIFLTPPASAIAVEVIGGSYVTYAILAAALAAAGYTVATNQVTPEVFSGILDSPNSELIKALIQGTAMYLTSKGMVYFNWTSAQWSIFTNWVLSQVATGELIIPNSDTTSFVNSFNYNNQLAYVFHTTTTNGVFGYYLANSSIQWYKISNDYSSVKAVLSNGYFTTQGRYYTSTNDKICYGSPFVMSGSYPLLYRAFVYNNNFYVNNTTGLDLTVCVVNNIQYYYRLLNNQITLVPVYGGVSHAITGTINFPDTYQDVKDWFIDCVMSGTLVGDFTGLGIGDDVINPSSGVEVGIDSYPDYQVGEGTLSIPDVIGGSIDIPLNPYIDGPIDLSEDPVPIDFTDWPDRTIETTPDDVVPDVRLNPPIDVTANPDTPWADEESYPLDYPTDTTTDNLPPGNNPNPDPGQDENTNRLKLGPILLSKFPFCLPWDLQHGLKVLIAPAEAPQFTIPFVNERLGINTSINIDLSFADTLAKVTRWFLSALWVVILILITSKIIWK